MNYKGERITNGYEYTDYEKANFCEFFQHTLIRTFGEFVIRSRPHSLRTSFVFRTFRAFSYFVPSFQPSIVILKLKSAFFYTFGKI